MTDYDGREIDLNDREAVRAIVYNPDMQAKFSPNDWNLLVGKESAWVQDDLNARAAAAEQESMIMPEYQGMDVNAFTRALHDINPDRTALDRLTSLGLSTGPTPFATGQRGLSDLQAQEAYGDLRGKIGGQMGDAESALAMRGGAGSGARERLFGSGITAMGSGASDIESQRMKDLLNIGIADESTKTGILSQIPGMEQNQATFDLTKATTGYEAAAKEAQLRNKYNMEGYGIRMGKLGADKTADAQLGG